MSTSWGIHWFRRDLRIAGNAALQENWKQNKGRTLGFFCFDSKFLSRSDFSHNRFAFFLQTLLALKNDLKEQGGDLLVIDCLPQEAFPQLLSYCKRKISMPSIVTWGRDYEPFARTRDADIEKILKDFGVPILHHRDHLLFEPSEILKENGKGFYQIYSPFSRKWFEALESPMGQKRVHSNLSAKDYFKKKNRKSDLFKMQWSDLGTVAFPFRDSLDNFIKTNSDYVTISIPQAGFFSAYSELEEFRSRIINYNEKRDFPAIRGTSKLSLFLKNGSLTIPQIIASFNLGHVDWKDKNGRSSFIKELVWREFYYYILYHKPEVEHKSFLPQYENLKWENNSALFLRWKEGTTGFPIVDAGMRELVQTGWMHNRVRMIVASFLVKDLFIDWRWGENYFMKELLDGDLAPNNGGWQWAASTGCDPQPYFRIFNPWLQSLKFDPDGTYIKKYVSELRDAPLQVLHNANADRSPWKYPLPIVNHSIQREKAIRFYKR